MSETSFESICSVKHNGKDETSEALSSDSFAAPPLQNETRAIRYYIEEDKSGNLLLPKIDGRSALKPLREAFETLLDEIQIARPDFKQTGTREDANLIITSKPDLDGKTNACTDKTADGRHRITFNSSKLFDRDLFEATAAHAFEISFGYPIRKYESIPNDPYFKK